jgi:hypothetical protein
MKAGTSVDVSGRINIEYIQQWERKSEVCQHPLVAIPLSMHQ